MVLLFKLYILFMQVIICILSDFFIACDTGLNIYTCSLCLLQTATLHGSEEIRNLDLEKFPVGEANNKTQVYVLNN